MQMIWCLSESSRSLLPTTSATLPPMPASISSKMKVFSSSPPVIFLMASMILESSPPEAILLSGLRGSPGFVVSRNSTSSLPSSPIQSLVRDLDLEPDALHGKEGELPRRRAPRSGRALPSSTRTRRPARRPDLGRQGRLLRFQLLHVRLHVEKLIEPLSRPVFELRDAAVSLAVLLLEPDDRRQPLSRALPARPARNRATFPRSRSDATISSTSKEMAFHPLPERIDPRDAGKRPEERGEHPATQACADCSSS